MDWAYRFSAESCDGDASMASLLGGKGANLAEMCKLGLPVPPGFTLITDACREFYNPAQSGTFASELVEQVHAQLAWLKEQFGYMPLVSVRSGAPVSMPGMMDTILNVGLTTESIADWEQRIGARAAWDSYRRLIQMLGSTAYDVPHEVFEFQLALVKKAKGVKSDAELDVTDLKHLVAKYKAAFEQNTGDAFPDTLDDQLFRAIRAVFLSWKSPRAIEYRKLNKIDEAMGTAVNVQAMVFGNMGEESGTGVLFTRDPLTGSGVTKAGVWEPYGEYLVNAQGEDVVAGIRTPKKLRSMIAPKMSTTIWPGVYDQLCGLCQTLEEHYRDMMDVEFTVQQGKLWVLQCRIGKRSAIAAFRIAVDLVEEGGIDRAEALRRITPAQYKIVRRPRVDPTFDIEPHALGLPASPGVAKGRPVFTAQAAVDCTEPCILVTHETTPDDIAGMAKAAGVLTAIGGATSHAAVVARAMDKPCVVGCTDMAIESGYMVLHGKFAFDGGDQVTIDGETGRVWVGIEVPVIDVANDPAVLQVARWAIEATGCALQVATPFTQPQDFALRIMAAEWWGDVGALKQVLGRLEKLKCQGATLDLTPPERFLLEEDRLLTELDGSSTADFAATVATELKKRAGKLQGLTLVLPDPTQEEVTTWAQLGYAVVVVPKTVADLLAHGAITLSPAFVNEVIGGQAAWNELVGALAKAGRNINVVPQALPPAYAVFTGLGK